MLMVMLLLLLLVLLLPLLCDNLVAVVLLRFRAEPTLAALVRSSPPLRAGVDCLCGRVGVVPVCFSVN